MQKTGKAVSVKLKTAYVVYKIMSFFVLVYGITSVLFYLFSLLSPVFSDISVVFSGYNSFSKPAFAFLIILFLFVYIAVVIDGLMLLKLSAWAITVYFFILIVYYALNIWITGDIDIVFLSVEIFYGLVLSYLKKKLIAKPKEE